MSQLSQKLGKSFVVTAELEPPRGPDTSNLLKQAQEVKTLVDAVNVTDSPMASLRMSSIVAAYTIKREVGLESIFHFTCRDRNSLALQADLLGAASLGLQNILTLTGDPLSRGDHPHAKGVFELDLSSLIRLVKTLNAGQSQGKDLDGPTDFRIAAAANPGAKDLQLERAKIEAKLEAGADFFQTQPVFTKDEVLRFLEVFDGKPPAPILYGVLPLRSSKMAERVSAWSNVPEALKAEIAQEGKLAGIRWAKRLIADLKDLGVAGVHLYPLGKTAVVASLLDEADSSALAA
ncbi:MAG: methylenetetrahydrofolate reductase [Trueperaceae bacterium]|nr:methylenetetrahydrofolate reductase [Trueperaceae bacterium]